MVKNEKGNKIRDTAKKLREGCKSWGGPFTTVKELEDTLHKRRELQEFIIKINWHIMSRHKLEKLSRPDLFRLKGIQRPT